jgi:hypothetical protein
MGQKSPETETIVAAGKGGFSGRQKKTKKKLAPATGLGLNSRSHPWQKLMPRDWAENKTKKKTVMNLKKYIVSAQAAAAALSVAILVSAAGSAQAQPAEPAIGLINGQNEIFTFSTADPTTVWNVFSVTPSQGDTLKAIDYYGGVLWGLGSGGNLYTINPNTGASSFVGSFGPVSGSYWGMDATAAGIQIVTEQDVNLLINYAGTPLSSGPSLTPSALNIAAIASYGGTLYGIDSPSTTTPGQLDTINTVTGVVPPGPSMGTLVSRVNGFDISAASGAAGYGWFASQAGSGIGVSQLFAVNLATGQALTHGAFTLESGQFVGGLTLVPEPSTVGLAVVGGMGLLGLIRRRK